MKCLLICFLNQFVEMMVIEKLNFAYKNQVIFEEFNFSSSEKVIAFKGPSGCGKSTLLSILAGNVIFNSSKFVFSSNKYLLLQEDSLCPWLTGVQNITQFLGADVKFRESRLFEHTASFIEKYVYQLSFGQRRMTEILRALTYDPDILMLDEPFNYIDKQGRLIISQILKNFAERPGKQLIITSHYQEDYDILVPKTYYFDGNFPIGSLSNEEKEV